MSGLRKISFNFINFIKIFVVHPNELNFYCNFYSIIKLFLLLSARFLISKFKCANRGLIIFENKQIHRKSELL